MAAPLKVIYLDFDGVLHDEDVANHPKYGIYVRKPGHTLFEWMPILESLLAPFPDVKIVLSTSWVRVRSFEYAKSQLSQALQGRVIGATFHNREMREDEFLNKPRGVQVLDDVARRSPSDWFAIDDDAEGWPEKHKSRLMKADGQFGVSDETLQLAIKQKLMDM